MAKKIATAETRGVKVAKGSLVAGFALLGLPTGGVPGGGIGAAVGSILGPPGAACGFIVGFTIGSLAGCAGLGWSAQKTLQNIGG